VHVDNSAELTDALVKLNERISKIETGIALLLKQHTVREFYTTKQAAELLDKDEYTVREWCRNGRVNAQKRRSGRGKFLEWIIARAELDRYQREGLLLPKH
jgi:hypothetical protein